VTGRARYITFDSAPQGVGERKKATSHKTRRLVSNGVNVNEYTSRRVARRQANVNHQTYLHEHVLLAMFLSVIVNVVPFESIWIDAVALLVLLSILAVILLLAALCCRVMILPFLIRDGKSL
jgi:formate hydrogenlyase subunit 4